jgi:hypothetical protein
VAEEPLTKVFQILTLLLVVEACGTATTADKKGVPVVALADLVKSPRAFDGRQVVTAGFLVVTPTSMNIVSTPQYEKDQICVGLAISESEYGRLVRFNTKWKRVRGTFATDRCSGRELCPYSCGGENLLIEPSIIR